MPTSASCFTKANLSEIHINIICDKDDIFWCYFKKRCTCLDTFPREIHIGLRFEKSAFGVIERTRSIESLVSFFPFRSIHLRSQVIHKKKPDIVPSFSVFFSGISESDDEFHGERFTSLEPKRQPHLGYYHLEYFVRLQMLVCHCW